MCPSCGLLVLLLDEPVDVMERRERGSVRCPFVYRGGDGVAGSPISWNELIELNPLSSSADEVVAVAGVALNGRRSTDFRVAVELLAIEGRLAAQNVWLVVDSSSSVSCRDEDVECTESSVLLCMERRLSRLSA